MSPFIPRLRLHLMYWHRMSVDPADVEFLLSRHGHPNIKQLVIFSYMSLQDSRIWISTIKPDTYDAIHISKPYVDIIITGLRLGLPDETIDNMITAHQLESDDPIRYLDYVTK